MDKAKASHTTLTVSKKVADAKLEEALAANTGWFGQKKDTAEILKMKEEITALDRDIADKAATIQKYDQLWKNEKSSLQQTADRINADREQALKYASFIEAGKKLVHQRVQQENERERSRPRERDQGVEL